MATLLCVTGAEAEMDALNAIVSKALGYPRPGVHVGGGRHVDMPEQWDGRGDAPLGWTKQYTANWVATAQVAAVPLSNAEEVELQRPAAQANLSVSERLTLAAALGARVLVDLSTYTPKAEATKGGEEAGAGKR
jgi:hypothetical protein